MSVRYAWKRPLCVDSENEELLSKSDVHKALAITDDGADANMDGDFSLQENYRCHGDA